VYAKLTPGLRKSSPQPSKPCLHWVFHHP
jgi:hypothetical protein